MIPGIKKAKLLMKLTKENVGSGLFVEDQKKIKEDLKNHIKVLLKD